MTVYSTCPLCDKRLVNPIGPKDAAILIASEFPGWRELQTGVPFSDRAGKVLRRELQRVGLAFNMCRITNLWLHAPHPGGRKTVDREAKQEELAWHLSRLRQEMVGRRAILLLGSEVAESVTGYK